MLDAAALIEKHRAKGVLVDIGELARPLLVGTVNRQRIPNFKRTGDFTIEDYDLLVRLIDWFGQLIATPHVLSQGRYGYRRAYLSGVGNTEKGQRRAWLYGCLVSHSGQAERQGGQTRY